MTADAPLPPRDGTLLPPNATKLERALEQVSARIELVPSPLAQILDPETCPSALLPFLAYHFSVDSWETDWPEADKRAAVAGAIALHRIKGTPAAVDAVLATFDALLRQVEWHEKEPPGPRNTFEIILPLGTEGGARTSAATATAIVRDVSRVKRLSQHFDLIQLLDANVGAVIIGAARAHGFVRVAGVAAIDTSPARLTYLQTEQGEPMQDEAGAFLEEIA